MSHCSPAGSCLAKSLLLHVLCIPLLSLSSQCSSEGLSASGMAMKKLQQEGARRGGGTKWVMSWLTRHCCLLTCVISALPREITSLWPEIQKDFQCTICYLAPMTCANKPLRNAAITIGTSVLSYGVGWQRLTHDQGWKNIWGGKRPGRDPCAADSLHVLHSWQWQMWLNAPGCSCLLWSKACLNEKNNTLCYLLLEAEFTLLSLTSAEIRNASLRANWWVLGNRAKSHWLASCKSVKGDQWANRFIFIFLEFLPSLTLRQSCSIKMLMLVWIWRVIFSPQLCRTYLPHN